MKSLVCEFTGLIRLRIEPGIRSLNRKGHAGAILCALLGIFTLVWPVQAEILISPKADETQIYAARELQRYFYQLTGQVLPVVAGDQPQPGSEPLCLLGSPADWPALHGLVEARQLAWTPGRPGPQGYLLKTITLTGRHALVIAGGDSIGCLYGVYGLLQDHFGVGFYLDGDVLPPARVKAGWPVLDENKSPAVAIRGLLPWTNFPQSPSSYSWADWKFILDQMARLRMNFLHIHNYNGQEGHNEMFHDFEVNGKRSRGWMPTARSGQSWGGMPGWEVTQYLFGAADLFDDVDFGSDCALHNDTLDNEQVFRKGVTLFQRIIDYAHRRGIKIGLGLDLDLIPSSYGLPADDPAVVQARAEQLAHDYPTLDYLMCFRSENIAKNADAKTKWRRIFDHFYSYLHHESPSLRFAVSGWGLDPRDVATLPADVICAPIAPYSAKCDSGATYGQREYWGCPWLERDMQSSEYYYPYHIDLSDTVAAWHQRAANMTGFYALTWRLADAISPKISFIAAAPWDDRGVLKDAKTVYFQFARQNYGDKAADAVTGIINQNEPFASDFGECEPTRPFAEDVPVGPMFNLASFQFSGDNVDAAKMEATDAQDQHGTREANSGPKGKCLGWIQAGDWTAYHTTAKLDFNPRWTRFEATVASAATGGKIEVHLHAPDGPKIGEALVPSTGGWNKWTDVVGQLTAPAETSSFYLVYTSRGPEDELAKAEAQLKVLDDCVTNAGTPTEKFHLGLLRNRIAAERDHILLNLHFSKYGWKDLPGAMESWVSNFVERVTDISSLGNLVSVENRFVQKNYLTRVYELRRDLRAHPPAGVSARGTREGVRITWTHDTPGARGYFIHRDGQKINTVPLSSTSTQFIDQANGRFTYTVTALLWDDHESPPSLSVTCDAGSADHSPPRIFVLSPPTSARAGQPVWIEARLLDNRVRDLLSATLFYRKLGATTWTNLKMLPRVRAVFAACIPAADISNAGLEYYIEASDGDNESVFPPAAPAQPFSLTVEALSPSGFSASIEPKVADQTRELSWPAVPQAFLFRLYRSDQPDFVAGPENFLTYIAAGPKPRFEDAGEDFSAQPLQGTWYYRVTALNRAGEESTPSRAVPIIW